MLVLKCSSWSQLRCLYRQRNRIEIVFIVLKCSLKYCKDCRKYQNSVQRPSCGLQQTVGPVMPFLVRGENTHAEELPDAQTGMPVKAPSDISTETTTEEDKDIVGQRHQR